MVEKKPCRLISSAPSAPDPVLTKTLLRNVKLNHWPITQVWRIIIQTQSVGRVPLEQSPEQRLGLCAQELRHSQTCPAGKDERHAVKIISTDNKRGILKKRSIVRQLGFCAGLFFLCEEYSLQNQAHCFFAVLPLKRQCSSQHLKLGDRPYNYNLQVRADICGVEYLL